MIKHYDEIDASALAKLVKANKGKRGFTYTHYNVISNSHNRETVKAANDGGFTINLSANNLSHADALIKANCGPVVTLLPSAIQGNRKLTTPNGNIVVVCPATYRDDVTCYSCELCAIRSRKVIVGFPAHGIQKKKADKVQNIAGNFQFPLDSL